MEDTNKVESLGLVKAIQAGGTLREKAIQELYDRYINLINSSASKYSIPLDDIQIVYAEAIVRLVEKIQDDTISHDQNIRPYLSAFIRNGTLNLMRKRLKGVQLDDLDEEHTKSQVDLASLKSFNELINKEDKDEQFLVIMKLMESLPPICKEIITEIYIRGVSIKDLADNMECSPRFLVLEKSRCLRRLRALIQNLHDDTQDS